MTIRCEIETERLKVKALTAEELKQHVQSPDDFANKSGLKPSSSLIDYQTREAILNDLLPNVDDPAKDYLFYTMWIIIHKQKKTIIGGLCFHGEPDENGEIEIGYGIDNNYRNQGFMYEALIGLIDWLKNTSKVESITAETEYSNSASIKLLEKVGFEKVKKINNFLSLKLQISKHTLTI